MFIMKLKKGVTLVELMLVVAIMAVTVSGFLLLYVRIMFLDELNRSKTRAIGHTQFVMEGIKAQHFNLINSSISSGNWNFNSAGITALGLNPLRGESIVTSASGSTLLNIAVTTNWQNRDSSSGNVSLSTSIVAP